MTTRHPPGEIRRPGRHVASRVRDGYRDDLDRAPHARLAERLRRHLTSRHDQRGSAADPCPVLPRFPAEVPVWYARELPERKENRRHRRCQVSLVRRQHREMDRPETLFDCLRGGINQATFGRDYLPPMPQPLQDRGQRLDDEAVGVIGHTQFLGQIADTARGTDQKHPGTRLVPPSLPTLPKVRCVHAHLRVSDFVLGSHRSTPVNQKQKTKSDTQFRTMLYVARAHRLNLNEIRKTPDPPPHSPRKGDVTHKYL